MKKLLIIFFFTPCILYAQFAKGQSLSNYQKTQVNQLIKVAVDPLKAQIAAQKKTIDSFRVRMDTSIRTYKLIRPLRLTGDSIIYKP